MAISMRALLGVVTVGFVVGAFARSAPSQTWISYDAPTIGAWQGGFDLRRGRFVRVAAGDGITREFDATPAQMADFLKQETRLWGDVIKSAGIRASHAPA